METDADRRRRGNPVEAEELPALALDAADPLGTLRKGLEAWGYGRLFVANFRMSFRRLIEIAVASLPAGMSAPGLEALAESPEIPRHRSRLSGVVTALEPGSAPEGAVRLRLVLPLPLPEVFRLVLENASRRAEDEAVRAYWVPLRAIERGSITVVDAEVVARYLRPLVVFRIEDGNLAVAVGAEEPGSR